MSGYFQGMVSRFNAGSRNAIPNGAELAFASSKLARLGISPAGAVQLVRAHVVTSAEDRELLSRLLVHLTAHE